jgi:murein L,D-transpeptidase YafK
VSGRGRCLPTPRHLPVDAEGLANYDCAHGFAGRDNADWRNRNAVGNELWGGVQVRHSLTRSIGCLSLFAVLGAAPALAADRSAALERGMPVARPAQPTDSQDSLDRAAAEEQRVLPGLLRALHDQGFRFGAPVFIRVFKESKQLELWLLDGYQYRLFHTYPVCDYSGDLGPKVKEGDRQAPEGFYVVREDQLNPNSDFHLSFDLGYPNAFDRANRRTGNHLMIHGGCVSTGCYAMTDDGISEIYTLVAAALRTGQGLIEVHIFPFRMSNANLAGHDNSRWSGFWANLKQGYDYFERFHRPPIISSDGKRYTFGPLVSTAAADSSAMAENCAHC